MFDPHSPDDEFLSCDNCAAFGQCDDHPDPYSDDYEYDDPYDVIMYDIDTGPDDLYALLDMLGDTTRSWYAHRRLDSLAASGSLRALVADIIIDSLGRRWNPLEHPRDRFGRFIETGGFFRWLASAGGDWARARVERIDSDGVIHARSVGNDKLGIPDGQLVRFKPEDAKKMISVAAPKGDLTDGADVPDLNTPDLDADIPDFPEASETQRRIFNALANGAMPAEDIDRLYVTDESLTARRFAAELTELQTRGLVVIDREGTRPRVRRVDLGEQNEIDGAPGDVPEDETPDLDDSPALTQQQRDLLDFIADVDRGEGDGVTFDELTDADDEDIRALVDAGALDETDDGRLHLVNPEEGGSDLDEPATSETPEALETPEDSADIADEILDAAEALNDIDEQDAFQHFAYALARPDEENAFELPELPPAKLRNAQQAADRWWAERNGGAETPDPNAEVPEDAAPNWKDVLNPNNQAHADGLADQWFGGDDKFLDSDEGAKYRAALKRYFDAEDLADNGFEDQARFERLRAERELRDNKVPQEIIDGWPQAVRDYRDAEGAAPTTPEASETDGAPEADVTPTPEPGFTISDVPEEEEFVPEPITPDSAVDEVVPEDVPEEPDLAQEAINDGEPDVENAPSPLTNDEASRLADEGTVDWPSDADELERNLGAWIDWQSRVAAGRSEGGDLNDELIREKAVADELGLSLTDGNGLLSWTSFMNMDGITPDEAERLYQENNGDVNKAALAHFLNRNSGDTPLDEASPSDIIETPGAPDGPDTPETPATPDAPAAEFSPSPKAVAASEVPEYAAVVNQKPFDIDDYPYITEDGRGLVNRQGKLVEIGNWYRANRGGEGDPDEVVGFYDQTKFPGWVLVRAPDGKLKGAHVLGQGKTNKGGLNERVEPPGKNPGEIAVWRAQRAARGGDRLDTLDQNNPANFLRGPNGRGQLGGPRAEVGMAVNYLGGGKKFPSHKRGVISRIGWDNARQQPKIYVLVQDENGGKPYEVEISPEMLELRNDPLTARPPTPAAPDLPAEGVQRGLLPDRAWQVPSDDELIGRILGEGGEVDYVDFNNAFVNPGLVGDQVDALVRAGRIEIVPGDPNGDNRPRLRAVDAGNANTPTPDLPEGAENPAEGAILNALAGGDANGLRRGELVDIDADNADEQLAAIRILEERGVIERVEGEVPVRWRRVPAPSEATPESDAENETEQGILDAIDGLGRDARGADLIDVDADNIEDQMAALRALVDRKVLQRSTDADGKPVYRRAPAQPTGVNSRVHDPARGTDAGGQPMTHREAVAALRGGADPMTVNTEFMYQAMKDSGRFEFRRFKNQSAKNIGDTEWAIDKNVAGPHVVNAGGQTSQRVYFVKKPNETDSRTNWRAELFAAGISQNAGASGDTIPAADSGLLFHPQTTSASWDQIISDHASYGFPPGTKFTTLVPVRGDSNGKPESLDFTEADMRALAQERVRLALYDYITNNSLDRHGGNQMYAKLPDGSLRAVIIDNGLGDGANIRHTEDKIDYEEFVRSGGSFDRNRQLLVDIGKRNNGLTKAELRSIVEKFINAYGTIDVQAILAGMSGNFEMNARDRERMQNSLTSAANRIEHMGQNIDAVVEVLANNIGVTV